MKNKYSQYGRDVESYKYGDYQTYGEYSSKEFNELVNNMYINHFESKEDKLKREAKEKVEKRNSKINQILGVRKYRGKIERRKQKIKRIYG